MDLLANAAATILGTDTETTPTNINNSITINGNIIPKSRAKRKRVDEHHHHHRHNLSLLNRNVLMRGDPTTENYPSFLARKWSKFEFFYPTIDSEYFKDNEFVGCLSSLGLDFITTLTLEHWRVIRAVMGLNIGRPRRFSHVFLLGERMKLEEYRQSVRQYNRSNPHGDPAPSSIRVGSKVSVLGVGFKKINTGSVLSVVSSSVPTESPNYLVQFDDNTIESAFYADTELRVIAHSVRSGGRSLSDASQNGQPKSLSQQYQQRQQLARTLSSASRTMSLNRTSSITDGHAATTNKNSSSEANGDEDAAQPAVAMERSLSQLSQFSQLTQLTNMFSQQSDILFTCDDASQVSDVSFFRTPVRKVALLACKPTIDAAFASAEKQAVKVLESCIINSVKWSEAFANFKERLPILYELIIRCIECMIVLQFFPSIDKTLTDLDSIILALTVRICSDGENTLDPEQFQSLLASLTSICGAVTMLLKEQSE